MEEVVTTFPLRKLRQVTQLTLDVMMYVDRSQALQFMFSVNKEARAFLHQHFISIQNGFINEGLIAHRVYCKFNDYEQLERLYFQVLKKNIRNKTLTLDVFINDQDELSLLNEVLRWINTQQQYIKLQFKVSLDGSDIEHEDVIEFLNSNRSIQLTVFGLTQELPKTICQQQCHLIIQYNFSKFLHLEYFNKLQILDIPVQTDQIIDIIPYLGSKFTPDHFKRIQVKINISDSQKKLVFGEESLDKYRHIVPKNIYISCYRIDIGILEKLFDQYDASIITLGDISVEIKSIKQFDQLKMLSTKAKSLNIAITKQFEGKFQEYEEYDQSVTEYLTLNIINQFSVSSRIVNQVFKIFKNIKRLDFKYNQKELTDLMQLPKIEMLNIEKCSQLNQLIGKIINPNKILNLTIQITQSDRLVIVLSQLKNLRSLTLYGIEVKLDYILLFTQMRALTSLDLQFYDSQSTAETLNQFANIYNDCKQLTMLTIYGEFNEDDIVHFVKQMIEQVKLNLNSRQSLLTLHLLQSISIQAVLAIHQMLEQDITVTQKLKLILEDDEDSKDNYAKVIPKIEEEKHPILHRYIQMKAKK